MTQLDYLICYMVKKPALCMSCNAKPMQCKYAIKAYLDVSKARVQNNQQGQTKWHDGPSLRESCWMGERGT